MSETKIETLPEDTALIWDCPNCGAANTDYTPLGNEILCERCSKWFFPGDVVLAEIEVRS